MTKNILTPTNLNVTELEQKIAPMFYSSVLLDSLWGGVDSYTVGDNSWHWDYTEGRMESFMGASYDPIGVITGNAGGYENYWSCTELRLDSYLGNSYDPMSIIYGNIGGYVDTWSQTQTYTNNAMDWLGYGNWNNTVNSVDQYLNNWLYW